MKESAAKYEFDLLSTILSEISPQEQAQTDLQMAIAASIADGLNRKGLEKNDLARIMNVKPSVVTKWLSGTYLIESEILKELEFHLGIRLNNPEHNQA